MSGKASREARERFTAEVIASAVYYTLVSLKPRRGDEADITIEMMRDRTEFWPAAYGNRDAALCAAKNRRDTTAPDEQGRRPLVYAVGTTGQTVLVP